MLKLSLLLRPARTALDGVVRAAPALLLVLLAGCAAVPEQQEGPAAGQEAAPAAAVDGSAKIIDIEPVRPRLELTEDILYKILVAEFAGQRGRLDISLQNYLELARETRDPRIVERATRIAVYARDNEAAGEAARLWIELDPLNPDPHQVLAVMALREGRLNDALEHLQNILDYSHGELDQKLWMIANLLSREKDQELIMKVMERLIATRRDEPEALYAFAHVAARLGELQRATELLERTLELAPENDNAIMSYIGLLQRQDRVDEAVSWLEQALKERDGDDFNMRLAYARLLTDIKRFDDARRQFEILAVQAPNNTDVLYALGLLYLQANRLDQAERSFRRLIKYSDNTDDAHYYLGRIEEERGHNKKAGVHYQAVQGGDNYFDAQVRMALILARQGAIEEARRHLNSINTETRQQKTMLVQAEAELLIEEKRLEEAMQVYSGALEEQGYNSELLYSRAMLAEKMDRLELLEHDLRRIIEREPGNAQALNALGYTLADRTGRFQEAYELIRRAMDISPGDYYILDSMGWVLYRQGKLDEAVKYLRRALEIRQDPEIAAHLGEVLWVMGDKQAARQVWDTALQETPKDRKLLDVIERFNP
jgi:tetratricopeptide (TPR) repeat protein